MTAFALGVDALFEDPHLGVDALWRAGGVGIAVGIRVIRRAPDEVVPYREGRFVVGTDFIDLRTSEVSSLAAGDTLEVEGEVLAVIGEPTRDRDRLVWTAAVRAP